MERWAGKIAVVTGASSGIGLATAKALVGNAMVVVGLARRKEKMETEMANLSESTGKFHAMRCDVAEDAEVRDAFEWIKTNVGKVQVLINNAGVGKAGKFTEMENSDLRQIVNVNLMGTVYCTKETLKSIQADNLPGHIININSVLGHKVLRPLGKDMNMYIASKHAVTAFSETLVRELMGQNIRVTNFSPGLVATDLIPSRLYRAGTSQRPFLHPNDVAETIVYLLGTPQKLEVRELLMPPLGEYFS